MKNYRSKLLFFCALFLSMQILGNAQNFNADYNFTVFDGEVIWQYEYTTELDSLSIIDHFMSTPSFQINNIYKNNIRGSISKKPIPFKAYVKNSGLVAIFVHHPCEYCINIEIRNKWYKVTCSDIKFYDLKDNNSITPVVDYAYNFKKSQFKWMFLENAAPALSLTWYNQYLLPQ